MKTTIAAIAITLAGTAGAIAEERVVVGVPGVAIEHRAGPTVVEHRRAETTGSTGCESKTVTKTNDEGDSKTVRTERCD